MTCSLCAFANIVLIWWSSHTKWTFSHHWIRNSIICVLLAHTKKLWTTLNHNLGQRLLYAHICFVTAPCHVLQIWYQVSRNCIWQCNTQPNSEFKNYYFLFFILLNILCICIWPHISYVLCCVFVKVAEIISRTTCRQTCQTTGEVLLLLLYSLFLNHSYACFHSDFRLSVSVRYESPNCLLNIVFHLLFVS